MRAIICVLAAGAMLHGVEASARGFCNVDGGGDDKQRAMAAEGAAMFYQGAEYMMAMLRAFEGSDQNTFREAGSAAIDAFKSSELIYRDAAGLYEDGVAFEGAEIEIIMSLARTSDAELVQSVLDLEDAFSVLQACADSASAMAGASERLVFASSEVGTATFSELLNTFTDTLRFGSAASATFAQIGGEGAN